MRLHAQTDPMLPNRFSWIGRTLLLFKISDPAAVRPTFQMLQLQGSRLQRLRGYALKSDPNRIQQAFCVEIEVIEANHPVIGIGFP